MSKQFTIAHTPLIEPETARLRLRQWRAEDGEPFVAICSDPIVMQFLTRARDRATTLSRIAAWSGAISERGWGFWAAELKGTGELIGFIGLSVPDDGHPYLPCVELGWRLSRKHWGMGYATEGARGCLKVAFEQLDIPEVIATTAVGNLRSAAVMERLKMERVSIFVHPQVPVDSPYRTHVLYRLHRHQWEMHDA